MKSQDYRYIVLALPGAGSLETFYSFYYAHSQENNGISEDSDVATIFSCYAAFTQLRELRIESYLSSNLASKTFLIDHKMDLYAVTNRFFLIGSSPLSRPLRYIDLFLKLLTLKAPKFIQKWNRLSLLRIFSCIGLLEFKKQPLNCDFLITDYNALAKRKLHIQKLVISKKQLSLSHGIIIKPMTFLRPDPYFLSSFSALKFYAYSSFEISYINTLFQEINPEIISINIPRHRPGWIKLRDTISSDIYLKDQFQCHKSNYILIISRPISRYFTISDATNLVAVLLELTQRSEFNGFRFLVKNHPKDNQRTVYRLLKNSIPSKLLEISNENPVGLAAHAALTITIYSNLSVDYAFYRFPQLEYESTTLASLASKEGLFLDRFNSPSFDYRGLGLTTGFSNAEHLCLALNGLDRDNNKLVDIHYQNYQKCFV